MKTTVQSIFHHATKRIHNETIVEDTEISAVEGSTKLSPEAGDAFTEPTEPEIPLDSSIHLETSDFSTNHAAYAMLFAVFADAINYLCIDANMPLITTPGAHPDSFPSVEPFDPTTAQYVISGSGKVGLVISSFLFGWLATKIGSRNCSLILMAGSVVTTVWKYFSRGSYWLFFVANFVHSFFGGSVAVGNGYMCLIFKGNRMKVDAYIGYLMATMVFSRSLGGLFAIFFPSGLFQPLIASAIISSVAFLVVHKFVIDPDSSTNDEDVDGSKDAPETLDKRTFANIVVGAFLDNIGSNGLVPLAFSPMLYQKFYLDFEMQGLDPIMNYSQYIWFWSMIAITVVPSALVSPWCYQKLSVAITCFIGNSLTGVALLGLVFAAMMPATKATYALCVSIIYIGFPLGVLSNLTTSPMLDRVTPVRMKTIAQGLNAAIFDLAGGFTPILLGFVSDMHGYILMLWICVGIQAAATLANFPLLFNPALKDKPVEELVEKETETDVEVNVELGLSRRLSQAMFMTSSLHL